MASDVPADLLVEIFHRLPKKSLGRFRCVSKTWWRLICQSGCLAPKAPYTCSFISNDFLFGFVTGAVNFHSVDRDGALKTHECPSVPRGITRHMMGSCYGFLYYCWEEDYIKSTFQILNPAGNQSSVIPAFPGFDTAEVHCLHGLGLAPDPDDHHYRLVVLFSERSRLGVPTSVAIFSSRTGVWEIADEIFRDPNPKGLERDHSLASDQLAPSPLYFNRRLHWLGLDRVVALCVETCTFEIIPLPRCTGQYHHGQLWVSEGRLNYCQAYKRRQVRMWVHRCTRGADKPRWRRKYSFSVHADVFDVCYFDEVLQRVYIGSMGGTYCYELVSKTISKFLPSYIVHMLPFTHRRFNLPAIEIQRGCSKRKTGEEEVSAPERRRPR